MIKVNALPQHISDKIPSVRNEYRLACSVFEDMLRRITGYNRDTYDKGIYRNTEVNGDFAFIPIDPMSPLLYVNIIISLLKHKTQLDIPSWHRELVFYDMGAGIGNITFLVNKIFSIPTIGVEKYKRKGVYLKPPTIWKDFFDLTEDDLKLPIHDHNLSQSAWSIFYFYVPIAREERMIQALNHIMGICPDKSIFLFFGPRHMQSVTIPAHKVVESCYCDHMITFINKKNGQ